MDHSYKLKNVHYVVQHNRRRRYVRSLKCQGHTTKKQALSSKSSHELEHRHSA